MSYQRNGHKFLIVKNAWMLVSLPMCVVVELPDSSLKFFGVRQSPYPPAPLDKDLRDYRGYHPSTIPTADHISDVRLMVFGLANA